MLIAIGIFVLLFIWLLSPTLIKWRWMTLLQLDQIKFLVQRELPQKISSALFFVLLSALLHLLLYIILGGLPSITDVDLSKLTINIPYCEPLNIDDLGLYYSFSGWWGIIPLAIWLGIMRYLYEVRYHSFSCFRSEYSGYVLLFYLAVIMTYFSFVGGSSIYGLAYSLAFLLAYSLVHLLLWLI
ncbi:MAG: hypothetical protein WC564_02830 [Patescibacteria group bacterium]